MAQAARKHSDPFAAARSALEAGRSAGGAAQIRQVVAADVSAAAYDHAVRLAIEFNLVSLARELANAGAQQYPRDAKLKRWAHVLAPPVAREYTGPTIPRSERDKDIEWLRAHADEYRGKWVILAEGALLAAGTGDIKRALRRLRKQTTAPFFIHRVTE